MKSDGTHHTLADLYHERTEFQFIQRSWRWAIISGTLIAISLLSLGLRGLNLGIDFEGGTSWQLTVSRGSASVGDVRDALEGVGLADAKILILGDDGVRVQAEDLTPNARDEVTDVLADYGGVAASDVSVTDVGPTWGKQVTEKALRALIVFVLLIGVYLSFRFEWKMAVSAIAAVLHDIIITAGVYAVFGFEVTPATVVAFLTILGFSLYDTVVVFDKVRENQATIGTVPGDTYSTMVNRSLNQVLMRSLNTSFVALLPVGSLLIVGSWLLGAVTLQDFALALFVGLVDRRLLVDLRRHADPGVVEGARAALRRVAGAVGEGAVADGGEGESAVRRGGHGRAAGDVAERAAAGAHGRAPATRRRPATTSRRLTHRDGRRPRRARPATCRRRVRPVPASSAARSASSEPGRR